MNYNIISVLCCVCYVKITNGLEGLREITPEVFELPPHLDSGLTSLKKLLSQRVQAPILDFECGRRESSEITFRFKRSQNLKAVPAAPPAPIDIEQTIVGGEPSRTNSWPWMALLGYKDGGDNIFVCSGVLINRQWILTAAHCLRISNLFVRLGEHDYSTSLDGKHSDFTVQKTVIHPEFNVRIGYHDLALLKLDRKIDISYKIRPVCLPWGYLTNNNFIGRSVTITGWGAEQYGGSPSPVLQEVIVKILNPSICQSRYSTLRNFQRTWPQGLTTTNIVCAGDLKESKDSCQGDSGGPITIENHRLYTLAGIVSKGHGCGNTDFPGLYAPVAQKKYLEWIKKIAFN